MSIMKTAPREVTAGQPTKYALFLRVDLSSPTSVAYALNTGDMQTYGSILKRSRPSRTKYVKSGKVQET